MGPRVMVNCACSADGKLASRSRRQVRISPEEDLRRVHELRASCDAVLVGVGTVLADDPALTVKEKYAPGARQPFRVVLDPSGKTPPDAQVLGPGGGTLLAHRDDPPEEARARLKTLQEAGAQLIGCPPARKSGGDERAFLSDPKSCGPEMSPLIDLPFLMRRLEERGIRTVMVEGGGETIWSFFAAGLVDELHIYHGSIIVGGRDAPTVADGEGYGGTEGFPLLELVSLERLGGGYLSSYRKRR